MKEVILNGEGHLLKFMDVKSSLKVNFQIATLEAELYAKNTTWICV